VPGGTERVGELGFDRPLVDGIGGVADTITDVGPSHGASLRELWSVLAEVNIQVVGELAACLRGGEPKPWPVGGVR
jgi:hypothetical protein